MFRHYLVTALRVIVRNRLYSAVNIGGLAVGLASAMLILLYIQDQTSYDTFWEDAEDLYMLQTISTQRDGSKVSRGQAPYLASEALRTDFPDQVVGSSFTFLGLGRPLMVGDKLINAKLSFVEQDYPRMYALKYLEGSADTAVTGPNSAALSISSARLFFGEGPYLGKTFRAPSLDRDFVVSAVFEDIPSNSSHILDVMVEFQMSDWTDGMQAGMSGRWSYLIGDLYVRLKPGVDVRQLEAQLPAFIDKHSPPFAQFPDNKASEIIEFRLANIQDVHLSEFSPFSVDALDPLVLWGMAALALVILIVASVNFVNLSLAQAIKRDREVALRKVLGSNRSQLIIQYLGEAIALSLVALVVALVIVDFALPWFEGLVTQQISGSIYAFDSLFVFVGLAILLGILAGLYPALVLSSTRPAHVLAGGKGVTSAGGVLNHILIVFQFVVAVSLIIATIVISRQISHSQSLDLGYEKQGLVSVVVGMGEGLYPNHEAFRTRFENLPDVQTATRGGGLPIRQFIRKVSLLPTAFEGNGEVEVGAMGVGYDYFSTIGVPTLAGRELQEDFSAEEQSLVISEAAAREFGFGTALAAVGQTVKLRTTIYNIIGVVPDLRLVSSKEKTPPMAYYLDQEFGFTIVARVNDVPASTFSSDLEALWQEFYPDRPMDVNYVGDSLARLYQADQKTQDMLLVFAGMALFVAGIGLFAMAAFNAERRTREIGIRKVLGASVYDIVRLMLWQFSKPVLVATLIAWPLIGYFMHEWLQGFAERVALDPLVFVLAGTAVLGIASLTVMGHAVRVARQKPIGSLRHE